MIQKYNITTREEYDYCKSRGIEPMRDRHFTMDFPLRRELQREIFGVGNTEEHNIKFYHYAWDCCKIKTCQECGKPLRQYSSCYISHILSRGANAETAFDLRNFNLLCFDCHARWENPLTRKGMRVYKENLKTIEELHKDYESKNQTM